jgi:two-component system chemotaxis response regulator CheV
VFDLVDIGGMNSQPPKTQTDILLESGTNELEVLVFDLAGQSYGVNVAKVREVILPVQPIASPDQPPAVLGMFNLRGAVLPLVDLHQYFSLPQDETETKRRRVIVTEFNGQQAAFRVDAVQHIHRISWQAVREVPEVHEGQHHFAVTGVTEIHDRLILMLDFESIVDHISMSDQLHIGVVDNPLGIDRASKRVLLAEDSPFIGKLMIELLHNSGYAQAQLYRNGGMAWEALATIAKDKAPLPDLLVTDIEMPRMDGLALTRRVKNDSHLSTIPVILFSSLITPDTLHKGKQVGADRQINKPQLPDLVHLIDSFFAEPNAQAA